MRNRCQTILMLATGLAMCGGDTAATGDIPVQIEDSAGVRIVEYAGMPDTAPFRFATEPRYRHGANPGDYAFQRIQPTRNWSC